MSTHFMERVDDVTIRVWEARVVTDRPMEPTEECYVVPLEWITRFAVSGSILRDFQVGKEKPSDYGFHMHNLPKEGMHFPWPVHQLTTKYEKVDRKLSPQEALTLAGLSSEDAERFWSMIDRLDGALAEAFFRAGFEHFDGKKECILDRGREPMIGDVFGTPDEDRPVWLEDLKKGRIEHYGKEFLRQHFIKTGFYAQVQAARAKGEPDPPYPLLPEDVIEQAMDRYKMFARRYVQSIR